MKQKVEINHTTILVTGAAGFIGSYLVCRLLKACVGTTVVGVDSMTDYNPIKLKEQRLEKCIINQNDSNHCQFVFYKTDIANSDKLNRIFDTHKPRIVVHLAAQAGVRYSIDHPDIYVNSNLVGMMNILECCRNSRVGCEHLVYASSSSVYGGNTKIPFAIEDRVDRPVSLYAATKRCDELLAYSYSRLYGIPCTGLRFFTVYGPAGRTDMAYYTFSEKLRRGNNIDLFNYGHCKRDFTYVEDIVEGIFRVIQGAPSRGCMGEPASYSLYNIGGGEPVELMDFVQILSEELIRAKVLAGNFDVKAHINLVPMQPGDVEVTYADSSGLERDYDFCPQTDVRTGLRQFAIWYKRFIDERK